MKRSKLLEMEAEVVALEEEFAAEKAKRKRCPECGGLKRDPKLELRLGKMKVALAEKRAAFREARVKFGG